MWEVGDQDKLLEIAGYLKVRRASNGAVRCVKTRKGEWFPVHHDLTDEELVALTGINWHQSVFICPSPKPA